MGSGASTRKKQQQIIAPPTTSVVPFNSNVPTDDPVVGETDVESKWGVADVDKQSSDQTITQYLTDLYAAYATGNGLRPSDLVKMMNDMSKHSGSAPDTITEEDANLVVSSMDKVGFYNLFSSLEPLTQLQLIQTNFLFFYCFLCYSIN